MLLSDRFNSLNFGKLFEPSSPDDDDKRKSDTPWPGRSLRLKFTVVRLGRLERQLPITVKG